MSTTYSKNKIQAGVVQSGYEADAPNATFEIPGNGIQDVDKAFFNLFSEKLPLVYRVSKSTGETRRIPVMFASGERFAVLSKQTPMRDDNGALILPMISISRSGVEFETTKGAGISDRVPETVIKRKIAPESAQYKNLLGSSRESLFKNKNQLISSGRMLGVEYEDNIYEYITIPTPKYFTAKYEVTIWCQYVQQLNDFLETVLSSFPQPNGRTIRIDSPNGYWFVAHFEQSITQDNNFSDYTDSERLVKATLVAEVPGFIVSKNPNTPNNVKRYTSSTTVAFDTHVGKILAQKNPSSTLTSVNYNKHVLTDVLTTSDDVPTDYVGDSSKNDEFKDRFEQMGGIKDEKSSSIGNMIYNKIDKRIKEFDYNIVSGNKDSVKAYVLDSNVSVGEEVYFISNDE